MLTSAKVSHLSTSRRNSPYSNDLHHETWSDVGQFSSRNQDHDLQARRAAHHLAGFRRLQPKSSGILDWTDCARATEYEFYLWRTDRPKPSYAHPGSPDPLTESIWGPPPSGWPGDAYFWQPVARNASGTVEGPISMFTVTPEGLAPTSGGAQEVWRTSRR